jgi:hypothetical protein
MARRLRPIAAPEPYRTALVPASPVKVVHLRVERSSQALCGVVVRPAAPMVRGRLACPRCFRAAEGG